MDFLKSMNKIKHYKLKATTIALLWLLVFDAQASIDTTVGSSKSKQETHSKGTEAVSRASSS